MVSLQRKWYPAKLHFKWQIFSVVSKKKQKKKKNEEGLERSCFLLYGLSRPLYGYFQTAGLVNTQWKDMPEIATSWSPSNFFPLQWFDYKPAQSGWSTEMFTWLYFPQKHSRASHEARVSSQWRAKPILKKTTIQLEHVSSGRWIVIISWYNFILFFKNTRILDSSKSAMIHLNTYSYKLK